MSDGDPLAGLQSWLQAAITTGQGAPASDHLRDGPSLPAAEGLAIYANAYLTRLIECLRADFPVVARVVGEDAFTALAVDYLRAQPPSHPSLSALGAGFPGHLDRTRVVDERGWGECLVALAEYERAIDEVFDGPGPEGGPSLSAEDLSGLDPGDWAAARLVPNPALRLLRFGFPIDATWEQIRGLSEGGEVPLLPSRGISFVALSRRDHVVRRLALDAGEHHLLMSLRSGERIGDAIVATAQAMSLGDEALSDLLGGWFARWTTEGLFIGLSRA